MLRSIETIICEREKFNRFDRAHSRTTFVPNWTEAHIRLVNHSRNVTQLKELARDAANFPNSKLLGPHLKVEFMCTNSFSHSAFAGIGTRRTACELWGWFERGVFIFSSERGSMTLRTSFSTGFLVYSWSLFKCSFEIGWSTEIGLVAHSEPVKVLKLWRWCSSNVHLAHVASKICAGIQWR